MAATIVFLAAALASASTPEGAWPREETLHFVVRHEAVSFSPADHHRIERIYEALHPALWQLCPWMESEKVDIYLYKDRDGYLNGSFEPPPWSGGLMRSSKGERALALYRPLRTETAAHELTHLYLHSFFVEKGTAPPAWLDEGLAGMLEADALGRPDPRDKGPVLRSPMPLSELIAGRPERDAPRERVTGWYRQARSVVRFLKEEGSDAKFAELCRRLRDGVRLEPGLRAVYGWEDLAAFEAAWLRWRPKKPVGAPLGLEDL